MVNWLTGMIAKQSGMAFLEMILTSQLICRLRSCEQAIGLMKNMQNSLEVEEKFVDGAIESLESLPAATAAHELDVSIVVEEEWWLFIEFRLFVELYISSTLHSVFVISCTLISNLLPNKRVECQVCVRLKFVNMKIHSKLSSCPDHMVNTLIL